MSSSNDPYKSRLFNFFNRQTIRFQDQLGITLRHLRSATEMGVQLLLYPAYLMVQTGRAVRQQLESKVQSSLLLTASQESESQSTSAVKSVPLDEVLNLVEPWLEARENSDRVPTATIDVPIAEADARFDPWLNSSPEELLQEENITSSAIENVRPSFAPISSQSSLKIQGIASLLDSHQLVLVDRYNRPLNILNQRQQKLLQQYLAERQNQPNLLITTTQKVLASLPSTSQQDDGSAPSPIKFFWQMLDWLQTSSVATTVNLFGESQLTSSAPVLSPPTSSSLPQFFIPASNTVTELETSSFSSTSLSFNNLGDRLGKLSPQDLTASQPDLPANPFQIRAIIKAAIDYFYGRIKDYSGSTLPTSITNISLETKTTSSYLPGKSLKLNLSPAEEQESWLSWNDIFSNTISSTVKSPLSELNTGRDEIQKFSSSSDNAAEISQLLPISQDSDEGFANLTYSSSSHTHLETNPDLLETKATTVGYVKHPLEQILEILDYIMVWVEEKFLQIWQLFKNRK